MNLGRNSRQNTPAYAIKIPKNLSPRIQWLRDDYFLGVVRRWNSEATSWTTGTPGTINMKSSTIILFRRLTHSFLLSGRYLNRLPARLTFARSQFTEGMSFKNAEQNPKIGWLVMTLAKDLWRGTGEFTHKAPLGRILMLITTCPCFVTMLTSASTLFITWTWSPTPG